MLILYNGEIITPGHSINPTAIAIQNGIITALGSNEDVLNMARVGDETLDLNRHTVLPGFTDAHIHFQQYALQLEKIDCETATKAVCLERIRQKARDRDRPHQQDRQGKDPSRRSI